MTVKAEVAHGGATEFERRLGSGESLRLQAVTKSFGKVRAVDNLDLEIPAGAFVTLLGPSGCGKSTTLSLIAGLENLDSGRIFLGQRDITHEPPNERRMAMVFQNYALYPHMTAFGNIAFSLKLQRHPKSQIRERVTAIAEMLSIGHLMNRKPGEMSGGQQQRVALGRAMVKEPVAFLLDEPFSNLDAALRARMRTEVKHLHMRLGTTSIFVTHDQEEAMVLSDLIAVMRDGKVVQYGSQHEIYSKPLNLYVATFVGKPRMSLIEGRLEAKGETLYFVAPGMTLELPSNALQLNPSSRDRVVLGLRAENVQIRSQSTAGKGGISAEVRLSEPIGSDTFVELAVGGTRVVARTNPDQRVDIGEHVAIDVARDKLHLFDAETEARLVP